MRNFRDQVREAGQEAHPAWSPERAAAVGTSDNPAPDPSQRSSHELGRKCGRGSSDIRSRLLSTRHSEVYR